VVVSLVGVQLAGTAPGAPPPARERRHGIEQRLEGHAVVDVGPDQQEGERDATALGDQVALGAGSASVGRVRAGAVAPLFAGMAALSTQARPQSMRSASCRRFSSSLCRRSVTVW
jgi:hypothetical protein